MISLIFLVMEVGICYNKWEKIFYTNGGCIIMSEENFNTENGTNEQTYSQPQQAYEQPQQAYEQPQQNYDQQAYNQNQQYAQQNYGYDQSQQGYGTYQQPQQQAYGSFDQTQYGYNQPASSGKGMAIASMVLGIISIPAICFWIVGLPCAIVGLILGILYNKKNEHSPMATAGIVCSIITIALLVLVLILCIVGAVSLSSLEYSYYY
jgi:hypothetical protein